MEQSCLQSRYSITEVQQGYTFITSAGVQYFLIFFRYPTISEFLSTRIYMFNIERSPYRTLSEGQEDIKVRNTILYVLDQFFQKHDDAIITICDIIDGKQFARKRLFDSWYRKFNNGKLIKKDADCCVDNEQTFVSLIFSAAHYNIFELEEEFKKLVEINFYT